MPQSDTENLWAERLQRFEKTTMTVAQFCSAEGVSQPSFYYWKRKLKSAQTQKPLTPARFMPVAFQALSPACSTPPEHAKATIQLPGGVRICIEVPTDKETAANGSAKS